MKRNAYNQLVTWKNNPNRKPLIINGARQVGKTWLLNEFGTNEFKNLAYFTCEGSAMLRSVFEQDFDIDRILRSLSVLIGFDIDQETLIVLDEVQEIPIILTALKYFDEQRPDIHIAVAGSLLGITLHEGVSFPVGKVDILNIYPMTFDEFLLAMGKEKLASALIDCDFDIITTLHDTYVEMLRLYYYIGGMPEAVKHYVSTQEINSVREIQKRILTGYRQDFSKHAPSKEVARINMVWDSIPSQLVKENKKFIYGAVKKGARAAEFELAIQWLIDSGIVYKIRRVNKIATPLKFYEDIDAFKLFILDIGLFGAMNDTSADSMIIGNNIFSEYKGAFSELYFASQVIPYGMPTYYYSKENSMLELDFLMQYHDNPIPIEIKAETNVKAKSLRMIYNENENLKCLRFSMLPYAKQDWVTNYPLFSACAIPNLLAMR